MKVIHDKYLIKNIISETENAVILEAEDKANKQKVALKRLKLTNDKIFYKLFKNEVNNLKKIINQNSVEYYDSFEEDCYLYIVMELCDENLLEFRKKKQKGFYLFEK